jgi:hypothetical protein
MGESSFIQKKEGFLKESFRGTPIVFQGFEKDGTMHLWLISLGRAACLKYAGSHWLLYPVM